MNRHAIAQSALRLGGADPGWSDSPQPHGGPMLEESPFDTFRLWLSVLRQHAGALTLWVALWAVLGLWYLHITPPIFEASAALVLEPRQKGSISQDAGSSNYASTLDSAQADSQIQVIKSETLLRSVFDRLKLDGSPEFAPRSGMRAAVFGNLRSALGAPPVPPPDPDVARARAFQEFASRVEARRIGQSYVLEVTFEARDPETAARLANSIVSAYIGRQIFLRQAALPEGGDYLKGRNSLLDEEQRAADQGVLDGKIPTRAFPDADAQVIGAALVPLAKAGPQALLIEAAAVMFALLSGIVVVAMRTSGDRKVRTPQQVWRHFNLECLSSVPVVTRTSRFRPVSETALLGGELVANESQRPFLRAIRELRTAVLLATGPQPRHLIGLVSWSRGTGRSTLASNLAHVVAASGRRTHLIDADFQHGALTALIAPDTSIGLGEALVGSTRPLMTVPLSETLTFIPSSDPHHSSSHAYLGSAEMESLLTALGEVGDVIVDMPALQTSADSRALASLLDGVVLVVEAGRTSLDEVTDALRLLASAHARVLGIVLNKVNPSR